MVSGGCHPRASDDSGSGRRQAELGRMRRGAEGVPSQAAGVLRLSAWETGGDGTFRAVGTLSLTLGEICACSL